jgi:WD40 repeat protein
MCLRPRRGGIVELAGDKPVHHLGGEAPIHGFIMRDEWHGFERLPVMMRAGLLLLAACSSTVTPVTAEPAPPSASRVEPAADFDALAQLGRDELAADHPAVADRAFAAALAKAEHDGRGHWTWPQPFLARISHFQFTGDGRWLVTGDANGRVDIWDLAAMRVVRSFTTAGYARSFAVSHDGKRLATCLDATQIWDLETGAVIAELPYNNTVAWSSRDHLIAVTERAFVDYDVATKEKITVDTDKINRIVATGGKLFVLGELENTIYDDVKLARIGTLKFSRPIENIAHIAGDAYVSTTDQSLIWHDLAGKAKHEERGRWYALAASAELVAATTYQGELQLYRDGKLVRTVSGAGRNSDELAFHPRGKILAAAGYDGASLWDVDTAKPIVALTDTTPAATALAFDASGERLAVGSSKGHLAVWTLASGAVSTMTVRPGDMVEYVAFGPDGAIATSSVQSAPVARAQSTIVVFDRDGKRTWWRDTERTMFLGYRPGSPLLGTVQLVTRANGYLANGLLLWKPDGAIDRSIDVDTNRAFQWRDANTFIGSNTSEMITTPLDGAAATTMPLRYYHGALQPGGTLLASSLDDGKVAIWDIVRKRPVGLVFDDIAGLDSIAWTPDGKTLVTASYDTVSLWNHATGARIGKLVGPTVIRAAAIRPDGRVVAVAYADGRVILWSLATGTQIATLQSTGELSAFVVAPDGAIDGTADDTIAWQVGTHVLPARSVFARQHVPNLLATRMAQVPSDDAPRAHLAGAAPPLPVPRCMPTPEANQRQVRSAHLSADGKHVRMCVDHWDYARNRAMLRRPAMCFDVDLATGKYEPSRASVVEALGDEPPSRTATLVNNDTAARICDAGVCREIAIKPLDTRVSVYAGDNYVAASYHMADSDRDAVLVYDIATGKRTTQFITESSANIMFVDDTLLATNTSLIDVHKGRRFASVPLANTNLSPANLGGGVWAFTDYSGEVVLQNVKTGKIASRFELPKSACLNESGNGNCRELSMLAAGSNLVLLPAVRPGDVMVVDQKGKLLADHHLPICQ